MGDDSWAVEVADFFEDIRLDRMPTACLSDAHAALTIIENIYEKSGYDHSA